MTRMERFGGKVVVVTGGGSGIGAETCRRLAQEGAVVVVCDVRGEAAEAVARELSAAGHRALPQTCDVGDAAAVAGCVERIIQQHQGIDVLVNCAAVLDRSDALDIEPTDWDRVLRVNLGGAFYFSRAVARLAMKPRGGGAIVNVASIAGMTALPGMASYVASKHGVVGLTRALAVEWGCHNIRVNCVCPGLTETEMTRVDRDLDPERYARRVRRIPLGRAATPRDQADAVLYLASEQAASVNGLVMNVDGGIMARSPGLPD